MNPGYSDQWSTDDDDTTFNQQTATFRQQYDTESLESFVLVLVTTTATARGEGVFELPVLAQTVEPASLFETLSKAETHIECTFEYADLTVTVKSDEVVVQ